MSNKSLENSPNVYDLQAIAPIEEILQSYFCHIDKAFQFQEATLEDKKQILRDIALEIDQVLHSHKTEKVDQYKCQSIVRNGQVINCTCGKCF